MPVQPKLNDNRLELSTQIYKAIIATALALPLLVGMIAAGSMFGGVAQLLPTAWLVGLLALVAGAAVLDESRRWWLYVIAGSLVTLTLAWFLAPVLAYCTTATATFGALAALAIWYARDVIVCYSEYLLADVNVPRNMTAPRIDFTPCWLIGA